MILAPAASSEEFEHFSCREMTTAKVLELRVRAPSIEKLEENQRSGA